MIRKLSSGEYRLYSRNKNPKTGKRLLLTRVRNRAEDFQVFLRHVRAQYRH